MDTLLSIIGVTASVLLLVSLITKFVYSVYCITHSVNKNYEVKVNTWLIYTLIVIAVLSFIAFMVILFLVIKK